MGPDTQDVGKYESNSPPPGPGQAGRDGGPQVQQALQDFRIAAESRQVESICAAYQGLREAAGEEELTTRQVFHLAKQAVGESADKVIVSAFSGNHCFMCNEGSVPCSQCQGSGYTEEDRACPACDGLAITACGFCSGTGWADRTSVPPEVATAVMLHRLYQTRKELKKLAAQAPQLRDGKIHRLPRGERKALAAWLTRMEGQLSELARSIVVDPEEQSHLRNAAKTVAACLDLLRA